MRDKKIFAIGFNKSGTTSLHVLFQTLGLRSYHGEAWRTCDDMRLLNSFDCFSDDIPTDLPKLNRLFPGSKYVLQVRELDSWIYSRLAHIERDKEITGYSGHHLEWDNTEYAVKAWIRRRNRHHLFALSYFSERPEDILVVNFVRDESAATRICNFLEYEGQYERPEENIWHEKDNMPRYNQMLARCATELGIPEYELKYDLYCPSLETTQISDFPADTDMRPSTPTRTADISLEAVAKQVDVA